MNKLLKIVTLLLTTLSLLCFPACKDDNIDLSAEEIAEEIIVAIPLDEGYYKASDSYFGYYFPSVKADEWIIYRSQSQLSENEFGIIRASGSVNETKTACESYLEASLKAYSDAKAAYSPSEYEKYRDAEVYVYGDCVIYLIMTDADQATALEAIEKLQ